MLSELYQGISQLIFPNNCLLCKRFLDSQDYRQILCPFCLSEIQWNSPPFFPDQNHRSFDFDEALSACLYNAPMKTLIYRFKYGQKLGLRHLFSRLMAEFIKNYRIDLHNYDLIIPIPLYAARRRERGYNQAEILALEIGQKFNIPLDSKNLKRVKNTPFQSGLSRKERWTNIQAAFKINRPSVISGKNILIVDDLITTGATCSQAAAQLKKAGAARVAVLTLALADT